MLWPSSVCHNRGGRSSNATTIATWLTGEFVKTRIARSAPEGPRKSHTSPVCAVASASVVVIAGTIIGSVRSLEIEKLEVARPGGDRRDRRRHRDRGGTAAAPLARLRRRGDPHPPPRAIRRARPVVRRAAPIGRIASTALARAESPVRCRGTPSCCTVALLILRASRPRWRSRSPRLESAGRLGSPPM